MNGQMREKDGEGGTRWDGIRGVTKEGGGKVKGGWVVEEERRQQAPRQGARCKGQTA